MNVLERLSDAVAELLRDDPRRVLLGEDVRDGGMLGLSRATMQDPALAGRALGTPLTPAASLAHATGLAMAGRRPIVLLHSATALLEGYAALRELGRVAATANGERSAPVLIVAPTGPGFGLGGDGADSPEAALAAVPGLRVVVLGDPLEAVATLRAAASFDDGGAPTLLLLPRALVLREFAAEEFKPSLGRPLGAARVVREGAAATVFAIGAAVDQAFAAVEALGLDVAIVEVSGLAPLDEPGILAAVLAVARLGVKTRVTVWAPMAENMPSGAAQRPSDVLVTYGGRTVEVLNTDAEGRLVLADALVAASEEQPDAIIDVATLTGHQVLALGTRCAAIMANDDDLRDRVHEAADRVGEQMWPMPLPVELRSSLDSQVADIANVGERMGGMLVAGLFLKEFVGDAADGDGQIPWAHLDIAGPSFNDGKPWGYTPKGGTGHGVRTLVALAEEHAARS